MRRAPYPNRGGKLTGACEARPRLLCDFCKYHLQHRWFKAIADVQTQVATSADVCDDGKPYQRTA